MCLSSITVPASNVLECSRNAAGRAVQQQPQAKNAEQGATGKAVSYVVNSERCSHADRLQIRQLDCTIVGRAVQQHPQDRNAEQGATGTAAPSAPHKASVKSPAKQQGQSSITGFLTGAKAAQTPQAVPQHAEHEQSLSDTTAGGKV